LFFGLIQYAITSGNVNEVRAHSLVEIGTELTRSYGERAQAEAKYFKEVNHGWIGQVRTASSPSDNVLRRPLILRIPLRILEVRQIIFYLIFNQLIIYFESSLGTNKLSKDLRWVVDVDSRAFSAPQMASANPGGLFNFSASARPSSLCDYARSVPSW
jgi:hypothetical protein